MGRKSRKYDWVIGDPAPPLEAHTATKHSIYRDYFRRYLRTLTADYRVREFKLTLVDGFSGGGLYSDPDGGNCFGSPFILLDVVDEVVAEYQLNGRRISFDVDFYFIEKDRKAADFLRHHVAASKYHHYQPTIITGTFESQHSKLLTMIQKRGGHSVFVLDQCGYSTAPLESIQRIFQTLARTEVILTYAIDYLLDYMSKEENLLALGFSNEHSKELIKKLGTAKNQDLRWRKVIQYSVYDLLLRYIPAKKFTPFFLVTESNHRALWLVHLSNHAKARDVMATVHWKNMNTTEHYGQAGMDMLGFNPASDTRSQERGLIFKFDDQAKEQTIASQERELPRLIHNHYGSVPFGTLFDDICNKTTGNEALVKESLQPAMDNKDIEIVSQDGVRRRRWSAIKGDDLIRVPAQKKLFYFT